MSNLFDFIYEEKDECNLLCGWRYGVHIINYYCGNKIMDKNVYYNTVNYSNVSYSYPDDADDDNINNVYVISMLYNDMNYFCEKYNDVDEICFIYKKMCGDREYIFSIYPIKPLFTLVVGKKWNVCMKYTAGGNKVRIWLNLCNGESHVNSRKE